MVEQCTLFADQYPTSAIRLPTLQQNELMLVSNIQEVPCHLGSGLVQIAAVENYSITSFVVHIRDPSQDTNGNWVAMTQSLARLELCSPSEHNW